MNTSEQGKSKEEIIDDILEGYESHRVMTDADYYEYLWDKGSISQAMEDYVKAVSPPPQPLGIDVEELKDRVNEVITDVLYSISGSNGHPVFDTLKCDEISEIMIQDLLTDESIYNLFKAGYSASLPSSSVTGEEDKDFIIQGLEEGSELWKAEYDNCRAILTELVYLKNLKDSAGKTEEYEQRQPLVWITAKMFLEKYQH